VDLATEAPTRLLGHLQAAGLKVDVLVNNAGFGAQGKFAELPLDRQLDMVQVNVTALAHLTGLLLPGMIERRRGGLLNVASTAAFQPGPGMAVYYATKAFVLSFTKRWRRNCRNRFDSPACVRAPPAQLRARQRVAGSSGFWEYSMSAASVARLGIARSAPGRVVAITGARNQIPALAVRFVPRAIVRKITKRLTRSPIPHHARLISAPTLANWRAAAQ